MTAFGWTIQKRGGKWYAIRGDQISPGFDKCGEAGKWAFRNAAV